MFVSKETWEQEAIHSQVSLTAGTQQTPFSLAQTGMLNKTDIQDREIIIITMGL